jgi:hypothetical protein
MKKYAKRKWFWLIWPTASTVLLILMFESQSPLTSGYNSLRLVIGLAIFVFLAQTALLSFWLFWRHPHHPAPDPSAHHDSRVIDLATYQARHKSHGYSDTSPR